MANKKCEKEDVVRHNSLLYSRGVLSTNFLNSYARCCCIDASTISKCNTMYKKEFSHTYCYVGFEVSKAPEVEHRANRNRSSSSGAKLKLQTEVVSSVLKLSLSSHVVTSRLLS
jgi:hypothetical protein